MHKRLFPLKMNFRFDKTHFRLKGMQNAALPVLLTGSLSRVLKSIKQFLGDEMDWFVLASEILAKKRREYAKKQFSEEGLGDFEKSEGRLSFLERLGLACILEMASDELYIIDVGTCSISPGRSNAIARKKILEVIKATKEEILQKGTFEVLCKKTNEEAESRKAAAALAKTARQNQSKVEDLKAKLKEHEFDKRRDMNEKQEIIASLKDTIHEEITKSDIKLRYIDRWEAARQGQNRMRCQNGELELERKLEEITNKCNNEIRVHDEICDFLTLEEKVLMEEVQKWKETYETEMKRRTEKIKLLEVKRKEQQILRHSLTELFKDRQKEINCYLELKKKIREEEEHERFINAMATKIQAWWRGTMVRRGLGPFKKKKKLGKEKKK